MGTNRDEIVSIVPQHQSAGYTDRRSRKTAVAELTGLAGASVSASNLIPAGATVYGVVVEVLTTITGAASFQVGDGSDADKWGAAIGLPAGTKSSSANFTAGNPTHYPANTNVVLTANTSNFTAGAVRVIVHYETVGA